ncbi:MAG: hypothetical protein ABR540_17015 [Acidimicrobiales bacterium]
MTLDPIIPFTYLAFELNAMLDRGRVLSMDIARKRVDDGTIFEWLDTQLESPYDLDGTPVDPHIRQAMLETFRPLNRFDAGRQFGVEHNGAALLLAYCIEGIQQLGALTGPHP